MTLPTPPPMVPTPIILELELGVLALVLGLLVTACPFGCHIFFRLWRRFYKKRVIGVMTVG